ncbi:MAG: hypothetical protein ACRDJV_02365 [Actinomycetota bacterium]
MTTLLGGSLLLIVLAATSIVLGWANSQALLIYVSIAASAGVAICLAVAYNRSRAELDGARSRGRRRSAPRRG